MISARFDLYVGIDWTGARKARGIGVAVADTRGLVRPVFPGDRFWRRTEVVDWVLARLKEGRRLLVGIDCAFSLPWVPGIGYLDGRVPDVADMFGLWDLVDEASAGAADDYAGHAVRDPRFAPSFWIEGPRPGHWGDGEAKRRQAERVAAATGAGTPVSVFHLAAGAKQVGKASLAGMRSLRRLTEAAGDRLAVWPVEEVGARSVVTEIYPTLFRKVVGHGVTKIRDRVALERAVARLGARLDTAVPPSFDDHLGDALIAAAGLRRLADEGRAWEPAGQDPELARREGWIFGVGA